MSKKLILALVLAGGLYYAFGRKKDEAVSGETAVADNNTSRWLTDEEAQRYLANHEDLRNAYGNDLEKAKEHFQNQGYLENRIF